MAAGSTDVVIKFLSDVSDIKDGVDKIDGHVSGLAKGVKRTALGIGGAIAGAFAVDQVMDFVGAAEEAQVASSRLAKTLENAGDVTGDWSRHAEDLSESLMNQTGIDDEIIKGGQAILATFHGVSGATGQMSGAFDKATRLSLDMAKTGFGDVNSAATMLGKALEDPVKGITALSRVGITFTADQKKLIETLVATGDKAGAMNVILANVESQVGGVAEATVTSSDKMSVAWGEMQEAVGNLLLPLFERLTPVIQTLSDWIQTSLIPAVSTFAGWLTDHIGPALAAVVDWIELHLIPAFGQLATWLVEHKDDIAGYFTPVFEPAAKVVGAIIVVGTAFVLFAKLVAEKLQPVLSTLGDWMNKNKDDVMPALAVVITATLVPAFWGLATAAGAAAAAIAGTALAAVPFLFVIGLVTTAIVIAGRLLGGWGDTWTMIGNIVTTVGGKIRDAIGWIIDKIWILIDALDRAKDAFDRLPVPKGPLTGLPFSPLQAGGIVTRPTLALIGERGPEAVIPLGRGTSSMGAGGNITINVHTTGLGADAPSIQSAVVQALRQYTTRNGPLPAQIVG